MNKDILIRKIVALDYRSASIFKDIESEVTRMRDEHEFTGRAMDKINVITKNYLVPADGCTTYN